MQWYNAAMATPPLPPAPPAATPPPALDQLLDRWRHAGLITDEQSANIRSFEQATTPPTPATHDQPVQPARPSGTELLAYLGVLIALAGVVTLVYSSHQSLAVIATLTLALGIAALGAALTFRQRRDSPPSSRAAGACLGLGAAAIGAGVGEFATAWALFTRTVVTAVPCIAEGGAPIPCRSFTSVSDAGNVLCGAIVAVAVAVAFLRLVSGPVAALVAVIATYVAAGATIDLLQLQKGPSSGTIALLLVATSAAIVAFGETLRTTQPVQHAFFGLVGTAGATLPLYLLGGGANVDVDVIGGVIAVAALAAGLALPRPGVAYGAVIGLAGLVIDIGARTFTTPTELGVFFCVVGAGGIAALIALSRLMKTTAGASRRSRPA